jgi:23S rRNA (pseudouridine1915-N3)-methyltransferase
MKIQIVAVGQRQPAWADQAVADFLDRFPSDFAVTLREVRPESRASGAPIERMLAAEALRLRAAIPAGHLVVALDERGKDWTSTQLAQALGQWRDAAESVSFIIGGPDGLAADLKREARVLLRLSSMTLPHALARVMLAEQLYRAWSLLAGHPYHRA